jgi:hypothetical protein
MRLSEDDKRRVNREFESFKSVRFPARSPSMFADERREAKIEAAHLHLDLVEYDAYIAGYVSRLCKGQDVNEDLIYFDEGLERRLKEFGERYPRTKSFVEGHLAYLEAIHRLIRSSKAGTAA